MKIRSVTAIPVQLDRDHASAQGSAGSPHRLTEGAGSYRWSTHYPALYSTRFETCLVQVTLEDGRVGWGEAQAPLAPQVPAAIVDHLLHAALAGEEFTATRGDMERLWWRMYSTMRVRGQTSGFMLDAIAGVDLALWDLAAQDRGVALRACLANDAKSAVPAYVSGVPGDTLDAKLEFARARIDEGFRIFKLYFDSDWNDLLRQVDALQALGPKVQVAVDALWHLPEGREIECAASLAERRALWLECPLVPEDVEGHARLVGETGVRLALGESYRTRFEAEPFFERDIISYWQPDLGRSGITETLFLAERAQRAGAQIVPHVSIAMPPQLHAAIEVAAALANCPLCEYNPSVVAMANRFVPEYPFRLAHGAYQEDPRPGSYFSGTGPIGGPGNISRAAS